jgi:hypothetical protein
MDIMMAVQMGAKGKKMAGMMVGNEVVQMVDLLASFSVVAMVELTDF